MRQEWLVQTVREETRRKLDRLLRRQRVVLAMVLVVGALLAVGVGYFVHHQPVISELTVMATVTVAGIELEGDSGQRVLTIQARLDDGRLVRIRGGVQGLPPKPASRIVVREKVTAIWGRSYTWTGEVRP